MRDERGTDGGRAVRLLTALVVLLAVLDAGLAAGGILLWRDYAALRAAVLAGADAGDASLRQVLVDLSHRQQAAARELAATQRDAARQVERFDRRAEELRHQGGGAVASASRAIELTQLMADEMLLQLKLMTTLDASLEKAFRPLPEQRALLEAPGSGEERDAPRRQARVPPER